MTPRNIAAFVSAIAVVFALGAPCACRPGRCGSLQEVNQLFKQASWTQALERVNAYLVKQPKDARGRFLKGLILTEQNKPAEAIKIFTALTEDYPELPEPYNNLAVLYAAQGQYDKARNALEMAIRTHPSYATAHENLGDIYAKMASQAYDKALQIDHGNATAQTKLNLIKELFSSERPAKVAVAKAEPALKTPPPARRRENACACRQGPRSHRCCANPGAGGNRAVRLRLQNRPLRNPPSRRRQKTPTKC